MAYSDESDPLSPVARHRMPEEHVEYSQYDVPAAPEMNLQYRYANEVNLEPQEGFLPDDEIEESWVEEFHEETHWLTKDFWAGTAVRAIRTFVQTSVATLTATGVGLWHAPWWDGIVAASGAAALSVLMSLDRRARQ